jgi:hypothetical protein
VHKKKKPSPTASNPAQAVKNDPQSSVQYALVLCPGDENSESFRLFARTARARSETKGTELFQAGVDVAGRLAAGDELRYVLGDKEQDLLGRDNRRNAYLVRNVLGTRLSPDY